MKKFLISFIIFLVATTAGTIYLMRQKNPEENKKKDKIIKRKECVPFTGGAFHLVLYKDLEEEPERMHVGIAVSPDSYLDLPTPEKEGYEFAGWYYDKDFKKKVEATNSREIKPVPEKVEDCIVGYQDIPLYAKWEKK
jgi:uncharacterized repeat protein (TIGR02543 family)